jgi:MaoC like domain
MSIAGVGAYTVGATILCALTTTASNVHAMMGMVSEVLWTEPNGRTVGCIHATAHPRPETTRAVPKECRYGKRCRPHRAGRLLHCSARELMAIHLEEPADLLDLVGSPLGTTKWMTLSQQQVDLFAESTGDHQWIHTDPQRAARGPFKGTVAHSFLTLSLTPMFISEVCKFANSPWHLPTGWAS